MDRNPLPSEFFIQEKKKLLFLKDALSSIFKGLGGSISSTVGEIESFKSNIGPYVKYFYPTENNCSEESFMKEVVIPSREQLDGAVDKAVDIMLRDGSIYEGVVRSIARTNELKSSVDIMIDTIESIEIHSINTMIISIKAGTDGEALAKISEEMRRLSAVVNNISEKFSGLLAQLTSISKEYNEIRERIEVILENNLTRMKLIIKMTFNEMIGELDNLSVDVNSLLEKFGPIVEHFESVMNDLQIEDIIRQDVEKVVFFIEEMVEQFNHFFTTVKLFLGCFI